MNRAGGVRVRGLDLSEDIRHRALKWDQDSGMWVDRDLEPLPGSGSAKRQLGRAPCVRGEQCYSGNSNYLTLRKRFNHLGPYMPVIYKACQESELAEEYRHGNQSYGAFTFALTRALRQSRLDRTQLTFQQLSENTKDTLHKTIHARQTPAVDGPTEVLKAEIPLIRKPSRKRKRRSRKKSP